MKTRLSSYLFLIVVILSSACTSAQPAEPTPMNIPATRAPVQPTATAVVSTAIPVRATATQTPVAAPTSLPEPTGSGNGPSLDLQTMDTITANLRSLLDAPDLSLSFQMMTTSPNAAIYRVALLVDGLGNSYYVYLDTLQPIEFTLEQPVRPSQGSSMTPDELQAAAEQLATRQSTRFERYKERLSYTGGDKGGENYFFRWEMPDSDVGGMPAILQFGFKQDGSLFSYLNSLDFLP